MLRSSMCYETVKDLTGRQYVDRIYHTLMRPFYSAVYKCPRVREIRDLGLTRSTHLHRFLTVPKAIYDVYKRDAIRGSIVSFYCFQSFSLNLSRESIAPFSVPTANKNHLILLRIIINEDTSARYISHYSAIESEDEVLALPCIPYRIIGIDVRTNGVQFSNFIRDYSGFDYSSFGRFDGFDEYIIITLKEESWRSTLHGDSRMKILNG